MLPRYWEREHNYVDINKHTTCRKITKQLNEYELCNFVEIQVNSYSNYWNT